MDNNKNTNKKSKTDSWIENVAFIAFIIGLGYSAYLGYNYIGDLEKQISERDSLISKLTTSENLVKEYFDIKYDSINDIRTFSLKESAKTTKYITTTISNTEYETIEQKIVYDGKTLTVKEFVDICNSSVKNSAEQTRKYIAENNKLRTLLETQKNINSDENTLLKMYKQSKLTSYSIKKDTIDGTVRTDYSIAPSLEVDSALLLLPYYRDKLKYDQTDNSWTVYLPKRGMVTIKRTSNVVATGSVIKNPKPTASNSK